MSKREAGRGDAYARVLTMFRRLLRLRSRSTGHRKRSAQSEAEVSDELRALVARQLTVEEYLDAKVTRAVEPLRAILLEDDLGRVRACLREHLRTQPTWRQVVSHLQKILQTAE